VRAAADRLDPPDLHRRLGERGLRRREPIVLSGPPNAAATLAQRLGLSDDELCATLDADPLELIGGELEHRPELPILLALTAEAHEQVGDAVLRRWLRTAGPQGRPLEALLGRDFGRFEEMLGQLARDGFVISSRSVD
jgi:hypothetical protein